MSNVLMNNEKKKEKKGVVIYPNHKPLSSGDMIPNVSLIDKEEITEIHSLITDHLIIVLASNSCNACEGTLETLYEYTREIKNTNILLIFNSDVESYNKTKGIFDGSIKVFSMEMKICLINLKLLFSH
ncbi:hypothetical protein [Paenibacillus tyrfis]|uniref:hypothetical protein n=1 Tax=Paenibacillus tyrfis TaxID=1501230 RepID=UPI000B58B6F7|nr:hypothetical protein [Paenibacillus tyrfis]